jgi:hypothetical protein
MPPRLRRICFAGLGLGRPGGGTSFENNRLVAKTEIGDVTISTVFISLDLRPPPGRGKLFETKDFGGKHDEEWLAESLGGSGIQSRRSSRIGLP